MRWEYWLPKSRIRIVSNRWDTGAGPEPTVDLSSTIEWSSRAEVPETLMAMIASKIFEVDKRRHGVVGRDNSCTKDINKLSKTKKFRLAFRQGESDYLVIYNLTYNCDTAIYIAYKPLRPRCNQMCAYNTPCNDQNFHRCPQTSQRQKAKSQTNVKRESY